MRNKRKFGTRSKSFMPAYAEEDWDVIEALVSFGLQDPLAPAPDVAAEGSPPPLPKLRMHEENVAQVVDCLFDDFAYLESYFAFLKNNYLPAIYLPSQEIEIIMDRESDPRPRIRRPVSHEASRMMFLCRQSHEEMTEYKAIVLGYMISECGRGLSFESEWYKRARKRRTHVNWNCHFSCCFNRAYVRRHTVLTDDG